MRVWTPWGLGNLRSVAEGLLYLTLGLQEIASEYTLPRLGLLTR